MKKQIISTILIGVLMISMTGCSPKTENDGKVPAEKQTVAVDQKPAEEQSTVADQKPADNEASAENQEPADKEVNSGNTKPAAEPAPASGKSADTSGAKAQPESSPTAVPAQKPAVNESSYEYYSDSPITCIDAVQISPKHVYYKGSKLYMEAFVYNGYNHPIFDIRNIGLRISNKSGVIAEAAFNGMGDAQIGPQSYIVWTFVFDSDMVKKQNADLRVLKTEYQCDNSF